MIIDRSILCHSNMEVYHVAMDKSLTFHDIGTLYKFKYLCPFNINDDYDINTIKIMRRPIDPESDLAVTILENLKLTEDEIEEVKKSLKNLIKYGYFDIIGR